MSIIKFTVISLDVQHAMTGAGDNQVIVLDTGCCPNKKEFFSRVKENLASNFQSMGLELKSEETWYSSSLFNYQRRF
jgi:hypothetical protein